jgi:hypothetical protein
MTSFLKMEKAAAGSLLGWLYGLCWRLFKFLSFIAESCFMALGAVILPFN